MGKVLVSLFLLLVMQGVPARLSAQVWMEAEAGAAFTGYNDVRIPGNRGTLVSLADELDSQAVFFYRLRAGFRFAPKQEVLVLYAPFRVLYRGAVDRDVFFQAVNYSAGSMLEASYTFNSYRATYRYYVVDSERFQFILGATMKVRDAVISFQGDGSASERTDLGLVPLLHMKLAWQASPRFGMILEADALAARQGRAEDVLLAFHYRLNDRIALRAGYRLLEGGADNARVYTFSMFHYASFGLLVDLFD